MNPCSPDILFSEHFRDAGAAPRIGPIQGHLQRNRPMPTPAAGEARLRGPRGGGTCVANAPPPVGYREPPRAATPCQNTKAAQAKPAKNSPIAGQKMDGKPQLERVLPQYRILQTKSATRGQPLLHMLRGEQLLSEWRHGATLPTARADPGVFPGPGSAIPDNGAA